MIQITVRQMEYFEALSRTRHFGRAAESVGVSQPALSAQIAEMEQRLGCRLFDRSSRGISLTEKGLELAPEVERILGEIRNLEAVGGLRRNAMEGRLRLGIIPTVAPYLLPVVLPALKRRYPALHLELREAVTTVLLEEVLGGRLDGLIAATPLDAPALTVEELFHDRFFLAVPRSDPAFVTPPVAPESVALERLMLLEEGHCMREQALAVCGRVRPAVMANYGATSLTTLMQMVAHGLGVTLIPEIAVSSASEMRDLRILPFADPVPERTLCVAWRRNAPRGDDCMELARFVRQIGFPANT